MQSQRLDAALNHLWAAADLLESAGAPRPRWAAEQLLARRLKCQPLDLYVEPPPVEADEALRFRSDVSALASGVPLQYLLGTADFYGREFIVGPGVFIPRPETEVLIDVVLASRAIGRGGGQVLVDVGTGSGAVAVTLALERPGLQAIGVDISAQALCFARENALRHDCPIRLLQGDLLDSLSARSADLIVANLPYLDRKTVPQWPRELIWEPRIALDGGEGGVVFLRRFMGQAQTVLRSQGMLILEMGWDQAEPIRQIARWASFEVERVERDSAGLDRALVLKPALGKS